MIVVLLFWFKNYIFEFLVKISDFSCMEYGLMRMWFYNFRVWLKFNMVSIGKSIVFFIFKVFEFVIID